MYILDLNNDEVWRNRDSRSLKWAISVMEGVEKKQIVQIYDEAIEEPEQLRKELETRLGSGRAKVFDSIGLGFAFYGYLIDLVNPDDLAIVQLIYADSDVSLIKYDKDLVETLPIGSRIVCPGFVKEY
jgi:hypothetical protein